MDINIKNEIEFNLEDFDRIIKILRQLLIKRGEQYNNSNTSLYNYFPFGEKSFNQMLWVKLLREFANEGKKNERSLDSLYDLINYAIFKIVWLDKKRMSIIEENYNE